MRAQLFVLFFILLATFSAHADEVVTTIRVAGIGRPDPHDLDGLATAKSYQNWIQGKRGQSFNAAPRKQQPITLKLEDARPEPPQFLEQSALMGRRLWSRAPDYSQAGSVTLNRAVGLTGTLIREGSERPVGYLGGYWIAIRDHRHQTAIAITATYRPSHHTPTSEEPRVEPWLLTEIHLIF